MITLCLNSFEIASKMPNFSAWVRKKILEEHQDVEGLPPKFRYKCPICKIDPLFTARRTRNCIKCNYKMDFIEVVE